MRTHHKFTAALLAALFALIFANVGISMAQEATPEATPDSTMESIITFEEGEGAFRVAHFAADAGAVDLYIDGELALEALEFGQVTTYLPTEGDPLEFALAVVPTGSAIEDAVFTADVLVVDQQGTLFAAVGSVADGTFTVVSTSEGLRDVGEGSTEVTIFHAIEGDLAVDVLIDGEVVSEAQEFGRIVTLYPNAGTYDIQVTVAGDPENVIFDLPGTELIEATNYLFAAVGTVDVPQIVIYGVDLDTLEYIEIVTEGDVFSVGGGLSPDATADPDATPDPEATDAAGGTGITTAEVEGLNVNGAPNFLTPQIIGTGFGSSPIEVLSGGSIDASTLGLEDCNGFITSNPDIVVEWNGEAEFLRFFVIAPDDGDTTLVIIAPDGTPYCDDDTSSLNPQVDITDVQEGRYAIYIGSFSADETVEATLYITEDEARSVDTVE